MFIILELTIKYILNIGMKVIINSDSLPI